MRKWYLIFLICVSKSFLGAQNSIEYYDSLYVWTSDFGYTTAPFNLKYNYANPEIKKLKFRNDFNSILGFGWSYRFISLRISFPVRSLSRVDSRFGITNAFTIGTDFSYKRFFFDFDYHYYKGFAIKDAEKFDTAYNALKPNVIRPDIGAASFSFSTIYFQSKQMKMQAFRGKTARYKKDMHSPYFKYSFQIHGMDSDSVGGIIPFNLQDSIRSFSKVQGFGTAEFLFIPGYAFVKRWKEWQIATMLGIGGVVQFKSINTTDAFRVYLGLAPRVDFRFVAGYNMPKYFLFLSTDFENRALRFNDLKYKQLYYQIRLVGGIRLMPRKQWLKNLEDYWPGKKK